MWNAAITNAGAALLTRWAGGGTLTIDGASASTGKVDAAALMACTALSGDVHDVQVANHKAVAEGMRFDVQFTAVETAYTACQVGVWAHLGDEAEKTLLAIFQSDDGIAVQDIATMPNFIYSFKATVAIDNSGEIITVTDSGAFITWNDFRSEMAEFKVTVADSVTEDGSDPVSGAAVYAFVEGYVKEAVPEEVPADNVTAGVFAGQVQANEAATAVLTVAQVRNIVMVTEDPGEGAAVDYPDGTVIHVYE